MQCSLLEPCAGKLARTVLRGDGAAMRRPYPAQGRSKVLQQSGLPLRGLLGNSKTKKDTTLRGTAYLLAPSPRHHSLCQLISKVLSTAEEMVPVS
jgi:hypothetical protein